MKLTLFIAVFFAASISWGNQQNMPKDISFLNTGIGTTTFTANLDQVDLNKLYTVKTNCSSTTNINHNNDIKFADSEQSDLNITLNGTTFSASKNVAINNGGDLVWAVNAKLNKELDCEDIKVSDITSFSIDFQHPTISNLILTLNVDMTTETSTLILAFKNSDIYTEDVVLQGFAGSVATYY